MGNGGERDMSKRLKKFGVTAVRGVGAGEGRGGCERRVRSGDMPYKHSPRTDRNDVGACMARSHSPFQMHAYDMRVDARRIHVRLLHARACMRASAPSAP
eukprot:5453536-Pleurochrysis_carterae.AAC.1